MIKGGYKIIDFKGVELSTTAVEITGVYNQIVDDYNKPIMISGVLLDGELQDDAYASVKVSDESVELTVYDGVITVTDDDEVTFTLLDNLLQIKTYLDLLKTYNGLLDNIIRDNNLDANNVRRTSILYSGTSETNLPGAYSLLITLRPVGVNDIKQIAIPFSTSSFSIYVRTYSAVNQIWTNWEKNN